MNRTLVESARCMLEHAGLSKSYWGEAVMTATFLRNRCPTRAITHDKSPHQVWTGKKPLLANLKCWQDDASTSCGILVDTGMTITQWDRNHSCDYGTLITGR
ncbi:hypothetical protein PC123_g28564 [Phytophthora cactorum]|nr:hypothetical protein PC123_g28564 [Phytophthora cactorum]